MGVQGVPGLLEAVVLASLSRRGRLFWDSVIMLTPPGAAEMVFIVVALAAQTRK
jgi:hypothetical protein